MNEPRNDFVETPRRADLSHALAAEAHEHVARAHRLAAQCHREGEQAVAWDFAGQAATQAHNADRLSQNAQILTFTAPTKLILVEDNDAYRYVLAKELRVIGLDVADFRLAGEALEHLDRDPDIKVVAVDICMQPGTLSGVALANIIQHRDPEVRVVLMARYEDHLQIPKPKPFDGAVLKTPDAAAVALMIREQLGPHADRGARPRTAVAPPAACGPPVH